MQAPEGYFDQSGRDDVLSGGVKLVPITTPKGEFRVWTKRTGNNPRVKVLLLHRPDRRAGINDRPSSGFSAVGRKLRREHPHRDRRLRLRDGRRGGHISGNRVSDEV